MSILKIRKVNTLPGTYEPSTLYMVASAEAGLFDFYMSTADGLSVRSIISKPQVQSMINDAIGSFSNVLVVADITARDALTLTVNTQVLVLDATADTTVTTGAALYIYDAGSTTWYKVSEFESMDVVLDWASIQNGPTSAVADIDDAVTKRHTHANKTELDKVGEDVNGLLTYNGEPVRAYLEEEVW